MENLLLLPERDTVFNSIKSRWQTDEFKEAHEDPHSFVSTVVRGLRNIPLVFFDMTEPALEQGHFTTWMGCIANRTYKNPYIHDLYLLHEIQHLSTMPYLSNSDWYTWYLKMHENEVYAALTSEVFVYFFMRQEGRCIRAKTFPFDIWADRFLVDPAYDKQYTTRNMYGEFQDVASRRKTVMYGFGVSEDDPVEWQIKRYAEQNFEWAQVWKKHYNVVECSMLRMKLEASHPRFGGRKALDGHLRRMNNHLTKGVFFREEAEAFADIFDRNNARFGNFPMEGVLNTL